MSQWATNSHLNCMKTLLSPCILRMGSNWNLNLRLLHLYIVLFSKAAQLSSTSKLINDPNSFKSRSHFLSEICKTRGGRENCRSEICSSYFDFQFQTPLPILLIRDMIVKHYSRRIGSETIHPTKNCTSMNLLQMPCVIKWSWSFLTSEVVEAVRGQKHHILAHTLALQLEF